LSFHRKMPASRVGGGLKTPHVTDRPWVRGSADCGRLAKKACGYSLLGIPTGDISRRASMNASWSVPASADQPDHSSPSQPGGWRMEVAIAQERFGAQKDNRSCERTRARRSVTTTRSRDPFGAGGWHFSGNFARPLRYSPRWGRHTNGNRSGHRQSCLRRRSSVILP
jgi:hypothetical protein